METGPNPEQERDVFRVKRTPDELERGLAKARRALASKGLAGYLTERDECLLHPDGSATGTDAGRWQCDQCAANDQYRERFFIAEAEVQSLQTALERLLKSRDTDLPDHKPIDQDGAIVCAQCGDWWKDCPVNLAAAALDREGEDGG